MSTQLAVRLTALLGTALIFAGLFISSVWDASRLASETSWRPYATAWIGVVLLVVVVGIALRAEASACRGSLADAPVLALGGVVAALTATFLFGGPIALMGGVLLALGGILGALGGTPNADAESLK